MRPSCIARSFSYRNQTWQAGRPINHYTTYTGQFSDGRLKSRSVTKSFSMTPNAESCSARKERLYFLLGSILQFNDVRASSCRAHFAYNSNWMTALEPRQTSMSSLVTCVVAIIICNACRKITGACTVEDSNCKMSTQDTLNVAPRHRID